MELAEYEPNEQNLSAVDGEEAKDSLVHMVSSINFEEKMQEQDESTNMTEEEDEDEDDEEDADDNVVAADSATSLEEYQKQLGDPSCYPREFQVALFRANEYSLSGTTLRLVGWQLIFFFCFSS